MNRFTIVAVPLLLASPAGAACHHYSVWQYPYPQPKCSVGVAQIDPAKPNSILPFPPPKPVPSGPLYIEEAEPMPDVDITIPLPSLENMEFPPDCLIDWCQRLKGVGMLRDKLGTN